MRDQIKIAIEQEREGDGALFVQVFIDGLQVFIVWLYSIISTFTYLYGECME
jgi:hypothetical protein